MSIEIIDMLADAEVCEPFTCTVARLWLMFISISREMEDRLQGGADIFLVTCMLFVVRTP